MCHAVRGRGVGAASSAARLDVVLSPSSSPIATGGSMMTHLMTHKSPMDRALAGQLRS
jgi:hypothetical protein